MGSEFISEKLQAITETMDAARMAIGEPGLPEEFFWRGRRIKVARVLKQWKDTRPCRHGSGERYNDKYWYELELTSGEVAKVYFLRPNKNNLKDAGWWLFTLNKEK